MESPIPQSVKECLWSFDTNRLDANKNKQTIIQQVLLYGTLADWRWLDARYGKGGVARVINGFRAHALRPGVGRLARLVFG